MADLFTLGNDPTASFIDANSLLSGTTSSNYQVGDTGSTNDLLSIVRTVSTGAGSLLGALFGTNSNNSGLLGGSSSQQPYLDQYGRTYYLVNGQAVYPSTQTVSNPSNAIVRYNTAATTSTLATDNTLLYAGLGLGAVALFVVLGKKK